MSREDDLVQVIIDLVREKERKERNPSEWLIELGDMCDELDALRERNKTAEVLEMLRR